MIYPVILCGGSGTRLWPSSRRAYPKQFAQLFGSETLYQKTLKRLSGPSFNAPLIMTNADFRFLASDQATDIGLADAQVIIEPSLKNTAPAVLAAALWLEKDPDALILVAPSDHVIDDVPAFLGAVEKAAKAAEGGALVTFGITPSSAETGYGYLELDASGAGKEAVGVRAFHEKPDAKTAEEYVAAGNYLWNAGIFLFRVRDIIEAYEKHAPDLVAPCRDAIALGSTDLGFFRLDEKSFDACDAISIDYAIMEKADDIQAVPMDCGWSDLGSWDAVWSNSEQSTEGVALQGDAVSLECTNTLLRSEDENIQIVGVGLKNIVAVAMRDAVLVADMTNAQSVKEAVTLLKQKSVPQAEDYPRFHRPWGWYETLCLGTRFQVKRIMVKPGGVLSLQSHMHRSEHWIVVAGTAQVTVGEEEKLLTENESVYIPLGAVHRMANPGQVPMYLIEVQTGTYLGEDDIVRYEDVYNR